jgi:hypothetical protein
MTQCPAHPTPLSGAAIRRARILVAFVTLVMAAHLVGPPALAQGKPGPGAATGLANQINNPAAPVTLFQFRDVLLPSVAGTSDVTNVLELQPVFPIFPSRRTPFLQLIKMTMPIASLPSPIGESGLGDLQFFDLISIKEGWGRWGFGPALVFPTATADRLGGGKWQAGPAAAAIYTAIDNLQLGAIFQNPMSFAGDASRPAVNNLIITPVVTYNFPGYLIPGYWKHGWFVGLTDYDVTFNWEDGGAATIPLGVQLGRVFHVGKQPFSLSFEAGGAVKSPASLPDPGLIMGIEFGVIFKGHRPDQ